MHAPAWPNRIHDVVARIRRVARQSGRHPLEQGKGRFGGLMVLKDTANRLSNLDLLQGITEQITHESHAIGLRKLHEHNQVRSMIRKDTVHWMPDTLVAVDQAVRIYGTKCKIERATSMTNPFRTPLPPSTRLAELQHQALFTK
jgi:hypothetical protein